MNTRSILAATLTAALALVGFTSAVGAQDSVTEVLTGTVVAVVDADGATDYYLEMTDGTVKLDIGPPWYWSEGNPLAHFVGQVVSVEGHPSDGVPDERAADVANDRAVGEEALEVRSIDGTAIWTTSTPPWAGGPAVVGDAHPGFAGWSHGQARNSAGDANAEGKAGGPAVVGASHPGHQGWSKGRAASAAKGANAGPAKAAASE